MGKLVFPREHGAWAMLAVSFLVGVGVGRTLSVSVVITACLVLSLFLARYPLTLLLRFPARKAVYWPSLCFYSGMGIVLLVPLLLVFRLYWLLLLGFFVGSLLAANLYLTARGHERSVCANLLGITGLCLNAPLAYYVTAGKLNLVALALWIVCCLFFGSSLFYVKMLFRESKNHYFREVALIVHLAALGVTVAGVQLGLVPALLPLAFVLPVIKVMIAVRSNQYPNLKRVGLVELAHSAAFLALVLVSFAVP